MPPGLPAGNNNNKKIKTPKSPSRKLIEISIGFLIGYLIMQFFYQSAATDQLSFSAFVREVGRGNVAAVTVSEDGCSLIVDFKKSITSDSDEENSEQAGIPKEQTANEAQKSDNTTPNKKVITPRNHLRVVTDGFKSDSNLVKDIINLGGKVVFKQKTSGMFNLILSWAPMILFIVVWIYFMRRMQGGGGVGNALSFGKSKAKLASDKEKKYTFADVAGVDEAVEEVREVVDFLKDPKKFKKLGGRIPKGILLTGPPGTGKTLLAKAVSGEAGVPFFSISGSDFVEMFVGVGASRVRDLFEQGKKCAPCIIFMDELDAIGRHRGAGIGGGHDEREQTLNQILVEMDGFDTEDGIIVLAATNRPDILDAALLRAGRFDRQVELGRPDVRGREAILKVHARGLKLSSDVDLKTVAQGTPGFVGADLANLMNEAAILAGRANKDSIDMDDIERAKDRVLMGTERKSILISPDEKKITAYHEAGHALAASLLPHADPVHKVTIIPRGQSLGSTQQLPESDRYSYSKEFFESLLVIFHAGRMAEEIAFGPEAVTAGAQNDFKRATEIARKMVCEWGMSGLGPIAFSEEAGEVFLGREITRHHDRSEATAREIDEAIKEIILPARETVKRILTGNRAILDEIAAVLLEKETIDGAELKAIISRHQSVV